MKNMISLIQPDTNSPRPICLAIFPILLLSCHQLPFFPSWAVLMAKCSCAKTSLSANMCCWLADWSVINAQLLPLLFYHSQCASAWHSWFCCDFDICGLPYVFCDILQMATVQTTFEAHLFNSPNLIHSFTHCFFNLFCCAPACKFHITKLSFWHLILSHVVFTPALQLSSASDRSWTPTTTKKKKQKKISEQLLYEQVYMRLVSANEQLSLECRQIT